MYNQHSLYNLFTQTHKNIWINTFKKHVLCIGMNYALCISPKNEVRYKTPLQISLFYIYTMTGKNHTKECISGVATTTLC